jgi:beta-lactamase regulating signal transducer with metallopeptidase domain
MTLPQFLSADLAYRLGWALIHSLWLGTVVVPGLWVVLATLRRRSPQMRYVASACAMALLLVSTVVTFGIVAPPISFRPEVLAGQPLPGESVEPTLAVMNPPQLGLAGPAANPTARVLPPPAAPPGNSAASIGRPSFASIALRLRPMMPWVVGGWAGGVLALSVWNIGGWVAAQRLKVLGTRPVTPSVTIIVEKLARRLRLSKPVRVLQSLLAETPVVIGWLRPVVLLPTSVLTGLTPEQLEAVLAHELAHIRRYDYLVNLFQVAIETLLFYHPAVWWMSRRIRLEREQCCDDVAVLVCGDCSAYVESLAALEEVRLSASLALAAGGAGRSQLLVRIQRLLRLQDDPPRPAAGAMIAGGLLLAVPALVALTGNLSKTKADTHAEHRAATRADHWKVTLPTGLTVELLGLSENPSDKQPWWKPDGSPLERPYEKLNASSIADKKRVAREIAVRFSQPLNDIESARWEFDGRESWAGGGVVAASHDGEIRAVATSFPETRKAATIRVAVAYGVWKTLAASTGSESVGSVLFGPVIEQGDGGALISVTHDVAGKELRVDVVDTNGRKREPAITKVQNTGNVSQITTTFPGLAKKDIKQIEFQSRDYEWAEFRDVALRPHANPATQPAGPMPSAEIDPWRVRFPCGVTAELVGVSKSPAAGQPWWRPDGAPMGHAPENYPHEGELARLNQPANQFAFLLTDIPFSGEQGDYEIIDRIEAHPAAADGSTYRSGCWPSPPSADWKISEWNLVDQTFSPSEDHTTLRLGLAAGPWNVVADDFVWADGQFGATSKQDLNGTKVDVSFTSPYEAAWRPGVKEPAAFITVAHNMAPDQQVRIVAVLADGREVASGNDPLQANGHVQQLTQSFRGLAIKDIKAFRLQARPYQWAQFRNVALGPDPQARNSPRLSPRAPAVPPATEPSAAQPATTQRADARVRQKVLLVTKGNYFLEQALRARGITTDVAVMTPDQYEASETPVQDAVVLDCYQPIKAVGHVAALYLGAAPRGLNLAETDREGRPLTVSDANAVVEAREDPVTKGLNLNKVFVAEAIKLREIAGWRTLVGSKRGPLVVSRQETGAREIVVAFDVRKSNWPLIPSFPTFLNQAIDWLLNADETRHVDAPATQPDRRRGDPRPPSSEPSIPSSRPAKGDLEGDAKLLDVDARARAVAIAAATQPEFVARLEFRLVQEAADKSDADELIDADTRQHIRILKPVELDERDVARAYPMKMQTGGAAVGVDFTDAGAKKFERLTAANLHHRLAIVFKGDLLSAPMIQTTILKTAVIVPGGSGFTNRQVQSLVQSINALTQSATGDAAAVEDSGKAAAAFLGALASGSDEKAYALTDPDYDRKKHGGFAQLHKEATLTDATIAATYADQENACAVSSSFPVKSKRGTLAIRLQKSDGRWLVRDLIGGTPDDIASYLEKFMEECPHAAGGARTAPAQPAAAPETQPAKGV